jgi:hypothetical protein
MARLRPGWLVALFAVTLLVSVWLPWLTTAVNGGGHANAIGGSVGSLQLPPGFSVGQLIVLLASTLLVAGAMLGRGLWQKSASVVALAVSLTVVALSIWYYHLNAVETVAAGYGFYLGVASAVGAGSCSVWALVAELVAGETAAR